MPKESTDKFVAEFIPYTTDTHRYPLSSDEEHGPHRVVFFINVQGGGSIAQANDTQTTVVPSSRYAKFTGEKVKDDLAGLAKSVGADLKILNSKKRLLTAISLYMPETLVKGYGVDWQEEDMSAQAMSAEVLSTIASQDKGAADKFAELSKLGATGLAKRIIANQSYVQKSLAITPSNSKQEMLFKGVSFDSFSFDYRFAPKNEKEAANVLNIIRTFRHHMLPEFLDKTGFLYIYPSEFEIRYYTGTQENTFLEHRITSVLTNMSINYTPNGQFTTFANGMPTHINMTLNFKELSTPTKETSKATESGA